ncbi:hypothetical protein [Microbulbifer variabilis]|uniref:hypothetical protein n=1 Tax=Microbulbifer variabilis TaxID=266805 RepID=UPI001CFE6257|nr:hypothetical protein [Microbulbifer variabilis]
MNHSANKISRKILRVIFSTSLLFAISSCTSSEKLINSNWFEIETEHFRIVTNDNPKRVQKLAEDLEKFRIFSRKYINFSPDQQKLTIYALADQLSFAGVSGSENSRRVIGRFENTSHGSFALLNLKGNQYLPGNPARQTLFHEYTHFLTYGRSQYNFPYWFSEGVAEVFSTVSFDKKDNFSVGGIPLDRAISLYGNREMPLKELLRAVPGSLSDRDTEALYASGWMLSHWLIFNAELNDGLSKFLQAYNRGEDPVNALPAALGMTFDELESIYQKLPKADFNYYKGPLVYEQENFSISTRPLDNLEAVAEIAHYMAITDQTSEVLRDYISYAEKKALVSPELMSALAIAEAKEENYSSAREILGKIEDKYQAETWYLEAAAMVALYDALAKEKEINVPEFKKIRDRYVELVNAEDDVPAYWHELAITMQVLGYPRPKYVNMLQQAYLRAPRDINIAWWYAHELYLNRDAEMFSRVSQPLLMQITRPESREHLESMRRDLNREALPFTDNGEEKNGLGKLMKDYQFLSENKALAMALDYRGAFVVGYIDNSASQTEANQQALQACEEQREQLQVKDRCELYAEGETIIRSPNKNQIH